MSDRYVCIHGHFYQPPRENPWLEYLERQLSAHPFHDWNERVTAECYAPNTAARILDPEGLIRAIHNNYSRISFNVGPTLLSWMERNAPETYAAILEADRQSQKRFGGHGSAIAQAFNHLIMPLANRRDKQTQVIWGKADFAHRFGRAPEGMWLPETAVDLETLDLLSEHGLAFTILAPYQAARVRPTGASAWQEVSGGQVDPRRPYAVRLPSGRSLAVFFYDGHLAHGVAFGGLLNDGVAFAERLISTFSDTAEAQLVHVATDGESYGHHHTYGEMALAYCLHHLESHRLARLTNYGELLACHPPTWEAEIVPNSSWSCAHGVERWRADCGCTTGGYGPGHQGWRRPLRAALDWLRDELAARFERLAGELVADPWAVRDDYVQVILDRSAPVVDAFVARHARRPLDAPARQRLLELCEMQRFALYMFTSCGWFFDDLARIETVQILTYAARAIQLAEASGGGEVKAGFLDRLAAARSNHPERGDGRQVWATLVEPSRVTLEKVGAHHAVRSLLEPEREHTRAYCFSTRTREVESVSAGVARGAFGEVEVASEITGVRAELCYAVLYLGDHTINGGVHRPGSADGCATFRGAFADAFLHADMARALRLLDEHFGGQLFSVGALFRDEQRRLLDLILQPEVARAQRTYERLYAESAPLLRYLRLLDIEAPPAIVAAGRLALNGRLRKACAADELDLELVHRLLDEVRETAVELDADELGFTLAQTIERLTRELARRPGDLAAAQRLRDAAATVAGLPFIVDLRRSQNVFFNQIMATLSDYTGRAERGDPHAGGWMQALRAVAAPMKIYFPF